MRKIYLVWLDDSQDFIPSLEGKIEVLQIDNGVEFVIDIHNNGNHFDTIARNIEDSIFFIDYNLKDNNGNIFDGDQIIRTIRDNNPTCKIFFYSAKSTQAELRDLISGIENVHPILRENIMDELRKL